MQPSSSRLSLKLFGVLDARYDGRPLTNLARRNADRLLAYLTLQQGQRMESARIAERLWARSSDNLDTLRHAVAHLRSQLGEEGKRLETSWGSLSLDLSGVETDILAFVEASGREDRESLELALRLYRGDLLLGWKEKWVQQERERFQRIWFTALRKLGRLCLEQGADADAVNYLSLYIQQIREEETVWRDLILALLRCGERILAQQRFEEYEAHLRTHNLLIPPAMLRLKQQIGQGLEPRPMPTASPPALPVGGAVPLDSPWYLQRTADFEFQEAVTRRDSIVLVKGPRQTGKSSLLARGLALAREKGARVIATDLQKISVQHWTSTEAFTLALARNLADQLELEQSPEADWSAHRGPIENFERYLRREVLGKSELPLVWGLDEIDRLFPYPFSSELFGLFRAWHNERASNPARPWHRLTIVMAYATEAHLFISDLHQSPFAVGTRVTLEDFAPRQIAELHRLYGAPLSGDSLAALTQLVGGHPYLTNRALYELAAQRLRFPDLKARATRPDGPFGDHLKRLLNDLCRDPALHETVLALLNRRVWPSSDEFYRLKSAGVLKGDTPENAEFRCPLYRAYLEAYLL